MTALRGARLQFGGSPWARQEMAQDPERALELAHEAQRLGANVSMVGLAERGPWVVRVMRGDRTLRFAGSGLADLVAFGLQRWAAGARDEGVRWAAGPDGLSHGHVGRSPWTLCKQRVVGPQFEHPERARCEACWRALDRVAA